MLTWKLNDNCIFENHEELATNVLVKITPSLKSII